MAMVKEISYPGFNRADYNCKNTSKRQVYFGEAALSQEQQAAIEVQKLMWTSIINGIRSGIVNPKNLDRTISLDEMRSLADDLTRSVMGMIGRKLRVINRPIGDAFISQGAEKVKRNQADSRRLAALAASRARAQSKSLSPANRNKPSGELVEGVFPAGNNKQPELEPAGDRQGGDSVVLRPDRWKKKD